MVRFMNILAVLFLVLKIAKGVTGECETSSERYVGRRNICHQNEYNCYDTDVYVLDLICHHIGASITIPYDSYSIRNIESVTVDFNISIVPSAAFSDLPSFSQLYLQNRGVKEILQGAFNSQHNLTEIHLSGNRLRNISDGIFNSLMKLNILDLAGNNIDSITAHAFVGTHLRSLYLNHNNLSNLDPALFDSVGFLETLDLSFNHLKTIDGLFRKLSLVGLNVSNNKLTSVDITSIWKIENLNLSNNQVERLKVDKINNIQVLDISKNKISSLKDILSQNLEVLVAGDNLINQIDNNTFENLIQLRELHLNNNNLSMIPSSTFKDLHNLEYLNLSTNQLSSIIFGTFDHLPNLVTLDISHNKFKALPDALHTLYNLNSFYFQFNDITDINVMDFMGQKPNLTYVQFNNNKWDCNKLMFIVKNFKTNFVTIAKGDCLEKSNVYGIECQEVALETYPNENNNVQFHADVDTSKLRMFFNENFTDSVMYKFFNKNFQNSSLVRYLEQINDTNNPKLTDNQDLLAKSINKLIDRLDNNQAMFAALLSKLESSLNTKLVNKQDTLAGKLEPNSETAVNRQSENNLLQFLDKLTVKLANNQDTFLSRLRTDNIDIAGRDKFPVQPISAKYFNDKSSENNDVIFTFIFIALIINMIVLFGLGYFTIFRKQTNVTVKKDMELSQLLTTST